jgi:hypothetical protein
VNSAAMVKRLTNGPDENQHYSSGPYHAE